LQGVAARVGLPTRMERHWVTRNRHIDPVAVKQKVQSSGYRLTTAGAHRKKQHWGLLSLELIDGADPSAIAQVKDPH
jgi:hypothetical protein